MDGPVIQFGLDNEDISLIDAIKLINGGKVNVLVTNHDETRAILFKPGALKARIDVGIAVLEPVYNEDTNDRG